MSMSRACSRVCSKQVAAAAQQQAARRFIAIQSYCSYNSQGMVAANTSQRALHTHTLLSPANLPTKFKDALTPSESKIHNPLAPPAVMSAEEIANAARASSDHNLPDEMAKADLETLPPAHPNDSPTPDLFLNAPKNTGDIQDAELIFRTVWNTLAEKYGEESMMFPKEIMWLAGAPGAGKGAMTDIIKEYRGITAPPIEVGALLTSPAAMSLKAQGKLVGNQQVVELLLEALLQPSYATGVVVDGFPRTKEQAECIKLLYDKMQYLRANFASSPDYADKFRRPIFHVSVLYIDKDESVRRQVRRGSLAVHHNEMVQATGVGTLKPVRETDLSAELAAKRFKAFADEVFQSLKLLKEKFPFHFIDASGTPREVQERIIAELTYQSSMELADDTFERVRKLPLASEVITNARHDLVRRLDHYRARLPELFDRVISVITQDFMHIIRRQALSGRAIIRSENSIFSEPGAIDMSLDLLSERGYTVTLDYNKVSKPVRVDLKTGEIIHTLTRVYEFQIEWQKPTIRK